MPPLLRAHPPARSRLHADTTDTTCQVEQRSGFWIIADAVKQFYEKHQCLPLPGKLPDMKAQSKVYIQLQNIYKEKARKDAAEVLQTVRAMPGGQHVDPAEVDLFCKNAAFVKLINATGGRGSGTKINRADRLKTVAGKRTPFSPVQSSPVLGSREQGSPHRKVTLRPIAFIRRGG